MLFIPCSYTELLQGEAFCTDWMDYSHLHHFLISHCEDINRTAIADIPAISCTTVQFLNLRICHNQSTDFSVQWLDTNNVYGK